MTCIKLADISESILAHHLNTGKGSENPSPIVLGVLFDRARVDRRWVKRRAVVFSLVLQTRCFDHDFFHLFRVGGQILAEVSL